MIRSMIDKIEKKRLAILRILKEANKPLPSRTITELLNSSGNDISDRTVRFHLLALDRDGLTRYIGRHGREITPKGAAELARARVYEKVGFLTAKIDQLTYQMKFDLDRREGSVVVNVSLLRRELMEEAIPLMTRVFAKGFAMGQLVTLFGPGEMIGDIAIPDGYIGVGTVCSITLNGVLLAHGIPTKSRFGGVLEVENNRPSRFVAIINYDGTSLDPLEIFIKSRMTDYIGATATGNGLIGASFREIPAVSRDSVLEIAKKLDRIGLGAIMDVGLPGQPLLEIPVNEGLIGVIVIGGLNPVAIVEESGHSVHSKALSGIVDFKRLFNFGELSARFAAL